VYVFGTADDVAPNFTTVAGAITYANSLTPIVTEPVVIRLFTKADGTPYDLTGLDSWTDYANDYIYFVSDFVRLNETTTLPTTLPEGLNVWYITPEGVEILYSGKADGSAWPNFGLSIFTDTSPSLNNPNLPTSGLLEGEGVVWVRSGLPSILYLGNDEGGTYPACGFREYSALVNQEGTNAPIASALLNTMGQITFSRTGVGEYVITSGNGFNGETQPKMVYVLDDADINERLIVALVKTGQNTYSMNTLRDGVFQDGILDDFLLTIRSYKG
jgi:hypothetical protein